MRFSFNNVPEKAALREPGFYWVDYYGKWEVAQWNGEHWCMCGIGAKVSERDFWEINEERIKSPMKPLNTNIMSKPIFSSNAPVQEKLISFALAIVVIAPLLAALFMFFCFAFLGLEFEFTGKCFLLCASLALCFFAWFGIYVIQ